MRRSSGKNVVAYLALNIVPDSLNANWQAEYYRITEYVYARNVLLKVSILAQILLGDLSQLPGGAEAKVAAVYDRQ